MYAEQKTSKKNRKMSKGINERKNYSKPHQRKIKYAECNSEHTSATRASQEVLLRVPSGPSQMSVSSSHVFADLACYKKRERSPSVVKNSDEDPACSTFSQNIPAVERIGALGQNINFVANKTEKESGSSGSSESACTLLSGQQT